MEGGHHVTTQNRLDPDTSHVAKINYIYQPSRVCALASSGNEGVGRPLPGGTAFLPRDGSGARVSDAGPARKVSGLQCPQSSRKLK